MYLSRFGFKNNYFILKSLLNSKFFHLNTYTFPHSKFIKLKFPLFDINEFGKSKLLIIMLNFLENITFCKPIIKNCKILVKKGVFYSCELNLTKLYYMNFLINLNEFILNNSLLKFAGKPLKISKINKNIISLFIYDFDFFFDVYIKRLLPNSKCFWFELEFYYEKSYKLTNNIDLKLYSQLFFCHNIFEWSQK
jgi:hypothetical protein